MVKNPQIVLLKGKDTVEIIRFEFFENKNDVYFYTQPLSKGWQSQLRLFLYCLHFCLWMYPYGVEK